MRNWPLLRRQPITPVAPHPGRRVADVVAPDAVTAATDHVQIDGTYARTVALTAYPRSVSWGWLHRIAARSSPLLLSVHITPQDSSQAIRQYMTQLTMLESSRLFAAQRGRLANAERQQAIADKQAMVQWLERGDERYIFPRHPSEMDRLDVQHYALQLTIDANYVALAVSVSQRPIVV